MSLRVHLHRQVVCAGIDPLAIRRFAKSVLRGEGVKEGGITVVLTDDPGIRALNGRYRGLDRATDVLAFPLEDDEEGAAYLGDVIVSVQRAREQAGRFGNDPEAELARLLTHGILHLLGYDHHDAAAGRKMKAAEERALSRLHPGTLWDFEEWA